MFKPFDNDHQSMQIGELIFENQTDKVIVYGDIDVTKTAIGLEQALKLKAVFTDIANALESAKLDGTLLPTAAHKLLDTHPNSQPENGLEASQSSIVSDETDCSKNIDNPFS